MGTFARLGNELYTGHKSVDFVGKKWLWYSASAVIVAIALSGLIGRGLNLGIEFTGGSEYTVSLPTEQVTQDTADTLREVVAGTGVPDASSPIVTTSGDDAILVQTEPLTDPESAQVVAAIVEETGIDPASDLSQEEIGASWGEEVAERSLIGLLVFLVLVVLFIWAYFREWKMSVAALVALGHDVVITVGVFALTGFEVTPATVTGVLTILGFSLYDTVVVFDKVRENTKNLREVRMSFAQAANLAVNQTLVRSINTSIVALIPVGVILAVSTAQLGASSLKDLSLALFVGMAAGIYSSVFIATPLLVHLKSGETAVQQAERRAKALAARTRADKYATVPTFTEDLPVREPSEDGEEADADQAPVSTPAAPVARGRQPVSGRGRVVPPAKGEVRPSSAAGRQQPTRQTRSKRGKK